MKRLLAILCVIGLLFSMTGCGFGKSRARNTENSRTQQISEGENGTGGNTSEPGESANASEEAPESSVTKEEKDMFQIEISVGSKTFSATLYDNAAARALTERLPMTLDMIELNGNEKYYYLDGTLPTNASVPSGIREGDLMLYGSSCLVLFYKSFATSYSYTPLGRIEDPDGLAAALGDGSVTVVFSAVSP